MIKAIKRLMYIQLLVIVAVVCNWSCKHEAGKLDKCLGKNLGVDTLKIFNNSSTGEILFDTLDVTSDKIKSSFLEGSIDGGKHWKQLPFDTTGLVSDSTYSLIVKDGDSCTSPIQIFVVQ